MKAADTSVVVAAFASWHARHEAARKAIDAGARLVEHCALETYSVLTRLPPPHRASPEIVREFLRARFNESFLRLDERAYKSFLLELPDRGIGGGAAYDALVAATVASHDAVLLTCDRRAAAVYDRFRVRTELIA